MNVVPSDQPCHYATVPQKVVQSYTSNFMVKVNLNVFALFVTVTPLIFLHILCSLHSIHFIPTLKVVPDIYVQAGQLVQLMQG